MSAQEVVARIEAIADTFDADGDALWRVLRDIAHAPHRVLQSGYVFTDTGSATAMASENLIETLMEPRAMALSERRAHFTLREQRWRFLRVHDERCWLVYDTAPNQVTAHLLRSISNELRHHVRTLRAALRATRAAPSPAETTPTVGGHEDTEALRDALHDTMRLMRRMRAILHGCEVLQNVSRLESLPLDNLVLNHHPLYSKVLHAHLALLAS